jgi:hypothetical protein
VVGVNRSGDLRGAAARYEPPKVLGGGGSERDEKVLRAREQLDKLEAKRLRLAGDVMHGKAAAIEEDLRYKERIKVLARRLIDLERGDERGGAS